ncbi:ribosomal protein L28e [Sphaeroforma arctica JP610]|uniref:Ribosomal protein L28e n=1 Tax=Sphaeroforma arctica JP610 TaxID=667725 RepID=A0A0L0GDI8_9EUKA|nr:ribosomal protein L28e [Sphaeroforma arctica JP610]KNC86328.1 ribosomal protein L28e [Sphaeroforma arctica JP610]|eukprot:XP_014160230.1 ribosomal protein L28e [Sphaeroforma arctica JP610]
MSSDLLWLITKDTSCFIKKSHGLCLNSEPMNLKNLNSFKYSGLCNKKAVGITAGKTGVVLSKKTKAAKIKPAKGVTKSVFNGKNGARRVVKSVHGDVVANHYRSDLADVATRRVMAIMRSQKAKTGGRGGVSRRQAIKNAAKSE